MSTEGRAEKGSLGVESLDFFLRGRPYSFPAEVATSALCTFRNVRSYSTSPFVLLGIPRVLVSLTNATPPFVRKVSSMPHGVRLPQPTD